MPAFDASPLSSPLGSTPARTSASPPRYSANRSTGPSPGLPSVSFRSTPASSRFHVDDRFNNSTTTSATSGRMFASTLAASVLPPIASDFAPPDFAESRKLLFSQCVALVRSSP